MKGRWVGDGEAELVARVSRLESDTAARADWAVAVTDTFESMAELATQEREHIESLQNTVNWLWGVLFAIGATAALAFAYAVMK